MANKLKVYQFEDTVTGKLIKFEGPEDASEDEINSYLESQLGDPVPAQPEVMPTVTMQDSTSEVPVAANPQQDYTSVATMGADTWGQGEQAQPLSEQDAAMYLQMVKDPNVTPAQIGEFLAPRGKMFSAQSEQELLKYREDLAKGIPSADTIGYRNIADTILGNQQVAPNENLNDFTASLNEGAADNPMGIVGRWTQDLFDSSLNLNTAPGLIEDGGGINKESLRKLYPNLSESAIEDIHDNLIGAVRGRQLAAARQEVDRRGVNPVVRFGGNMLGSISPLDIVPLGKGASFGARLAEGAYSNALADAALQATDVAYGAQDQYNWGQTAQAGLEGLVMQGGLEGAARGLGKIYSAVRGPSAPETTTTNAPSEGPAIVAPTSRKTYKKYQTQVAEAIDQTIAHVDSTTSNWTNRPNVEVHQNFDGIQGVENDALGVYNAETGVVSLNMERVFQEAKRAKVSPDVVVNSTLFHESLGHYGLAQKFGDDLDTILDSFYTSGQEGFKERVDTWLAKNKDAYQNDPNRVIRATEEVLAEMSERGQMPAKLVDRLVAKFKEYARKVGIDLKFSEREISTILSQAHAAVVSGKGRDVVGNGFRLMMVGHKAGNANHYRLKEAQLAAARGADVSVGSKTQTDTGWFKGPDGGWRFEIDDSLVDTKPTNINEIASRMDVPEWQVSSATSGNLFDDLANKEWRKDFGESAKLSDVIEHPELFNAYPELGNITFSRDTPFLDFGRSIQGWYNSKTKTLNVTPYAEDPIGTMLHEIQHAIQDIEGFAQGGNSDTAISKMTPELLLSASRNFIQYTKKNLSDAIVKHRALSNSYYNDPLIKAWRVARLEEKRLQDIRTDLRKKLDSENADPFKDPEYRALMEQHDASSKAVLDARSAFLESMGYPGIRYASELPKKVEQQLAAIEYALITPNKSDSDIVKSLVESELTITADKVKLDKLEVAADNGDISYLKDFFKSDRDASFEAYENLFGEVEARDTAARKNLTPEERKRVTPYSSQDYIDSSEYIYDYGDGVSANSFVEPTRPNKENPEKVAPTQQEAKTFLKELGVFNNSELMRMSFDDAISRATKLGIDEEWLAYYRGAKWDPVTKSTSSLVPRPDMSKYLPDIKFPGMKYSKRFNPDNVLTATPKEVIDDLTSDFAPSYRSHAEAKRAATDRGISLKQVNKLGSVGELDRRLFAYDKVAKDALSTLSTLNAKMGTPKWSVADRAKYQETLFQTNLLIGKIIGDQGEVGRALAAIRAIEISKKNLLAYQEFLSTHPDNPINGFNDEESMMKFARQFQALLDSGNPTGAMNMVRSSVKPYWWQYILSFRHAAMLSGLGTHAKNAYDNFNMLFRMVEEEAVAAVGGKAIRSILRGGGKDVMPGVSGARITARTYGLMRALLDSNTYTATRDAFLKGHGSTQYSAKIEMSDARIPILSKVNDALFASDTFFRAFHQNANLYALGVTRAEADGFSGIRALEEGSVRATNPDAEMLAESDRMTDEALLVDSPSMLSSWAEVAKAIRPNMTGGQQAAAFTANLLLPFLRVTDRLLFQMIRRSPLAILDKNTRADFRAGGARRDIAIGRALMGSALMAYYWEQAGEGEVTGKEPKDYKKTQALEAGGYKPNAIVSDTQYTDASALNLSFLPQDVQNNVATSIASLRRDYESGKDVGDTVSAVFRSLTSLLASQSYAENLSNYMAPFQARSETEEESAWANVVGSQASSFVPAALRQANQQIFDPIKRDTSGDKSFTDRVYGRVASGIPGLSNDLPERRDLYGDTMPQGRSALGMDNYTPIKQDDVSQELQRLERTTDKPVVTGAPSSFEINFEDYGITPENVNPEVVAKAEDGRINLTAAGKQEWQRVQGYYLRTWMQEEISAPGWKGLTDDERIAIVKDVKQEARDAAKEYMLPLIYTPQEEGL